MTQNLEKELLLEAVAEELILSHAHLSIPLPGLYIHTRLTVSLEKESKAVKTLKRIDERLISKELYF